MALRDRIKTLRRIRAGDLLPNPKNWRTHPQAQQDALRGILAEVGIADALLVRKTPEGQFQLIDGHLRADTDPDTKWPCLVLDVDEREADKLLATVDPLAALAERDEDKLGALLADMEVRSDALAAMLKDLAPKVLEKLTDVEAQVDRAEELQQEWGTEKGQKWRIEGKRTHWLVCGDSTSREDVENLLGGAVPFIMVTDPPYGVNYRPEWRNEAAAAGHLSYAARRVGEVQNDDRIDWSDAYRLFPGDVAYTWSPPGDHVILTGQAIQSAGFQIRNQIIWSKPHFPISRGAYTYQHEPCWYAVRKGVKSKWVGDNNESTVWRISLDKNTEGGHGTQKPLECMARPIRNHGDSSDDVYDPFLGSGTTMLASEQLGRSCYGMEIEPKYCGVILQRMKDAGCEVTQ